MGRSLIKREFVGLTAATIATHLVGISNEDWLADNSLGLADGRVDFGMGDDAADQSGNGRSDENRLLRFVHNLISLNFILARNPKLSRFLRKIKPTIPSSNSASPWRILKPAICFLA
jgi:hypothetical protein